MQFCLEPSHLGEIFLFLICNSYFLSFITFPIHFYFSFVSLLYFPIPLLFPYSILISIFILNNFNFREYSVLIFIFSSQWQVMMSYWALNDFRHSSVSCTFCCCFHKSLFSKQWVELNIEPLWIGHLLTENIPNNTRRVIQTNR